MFKDKKLGSGGQANVYQCEIQGQKGVRYADKLREAQNNNAVSNQAFKEAYQEFVIAKHLNHPNVVTYRHFVKTIENGKAKYHLIMDIVPGINMK